ncbi:MAG: Xaa-Pro peptidase family protein [Oscillospiraceae bacterium]|nr:Xaa-Pro peptidase family protein [Oscillospiraceae bacterium]
MSRFSKIAEKLDAYGLDAMMITSWPNRLYATQFKSSAGMAIVTKTESYFFTDSRYIEAAEKNITGADIRLNTNDVSLTDLANEAIKAHGIQRLGFEDQYASVSEFNGWQKKLKGVELVPATGLLLELRMVKDEEEVKRLIAAQRIAEKALQDVLDFIKPGKTEKEISAYLQYRMLCHGAEKLSFEPIVVSGANSSMPHGVPTDKPVADGDFITMDFGCVHGGYCSDMTRTVAVGHATGEMEKVYYTVLEAQKAGIAAAKGGVTGKFVHEAGAKVIADAGYGAYFGHGFGHSLGVEIHENPRFAPSNNNPIPAGAVLSAEPGIYLPGRFGVRIEDVIILKEDGCVDIMEAPHELIILK